jgi:hypothetical protein
MKNWFRTLIARLLPNRTTQVTDWRGRPLAAGAPGQTEERPLGTLRPSGLILLKQLSQ